MSESPQEALQSAVVAAGGFTALGRRLGISGEAIMQWDMVPPRRVLEVEKVTGISRFLLRPDIYPPSEAAE
jgi:DNA-binding transcriptional regulator YdaS (Cro superfamily)